MGLVQKKNKQLSTYIVAFAPVVLWAILIFVLSNQPVLPGPPSVSLDFFFKKIGHITVYAVLWWLLHRAFSSTHPKNKFALTWLSLLIVLVYAVSDEYHQSLVPGRHPGFKDVGYDMLGASIAWMKKHSYI